MKHQIHHFHLDHNIPCLLPEILHNHCFQFLLGITVLSRPKRNRRSYNDYAKFLGGGGGGVNKVHYCLSENGQQNTSRFSTEMKHLLQFNEMFY